MNNKKIEAGDYTYNKFIEKGTDIHLVPSLQRPYTWSTKEVNKFINDVITNETGYYIGSIVMVSSEGSTKRDEIIDGQQRLTTISLILVAIRKSLVKNNINDTETQNSILNLLVKPQHNSDGLIRLMFTNENSQSIYESIVLDKPFVSAKTDVQKKFEENLNTISDVIEKNVLKNKKFIKEFIEKILNLELIFITCSNKSSAYILFESINATGISLASTDLIKNSILQKVANSSELLSKSEEKWLELEKIFDEDASEIKTFLRHEWISRGKYTSHTKIFDDFKDHFSESKPEVIYDYLVELVDSAQIYSSIRHASTEYLYDKNEKRFNVAEVKQSLEFLSFLGVDQVYSVLLFVYKNDNKNFRKELNKFVAFQFLYKYLPGSPSVVEKKFANFCAKKDKNKIHTELLKLCENKAEDFVEIFMEKIKYKKGKSGDIQFLLEKISQIKDGGLFEKPTLEHIISQNPKQREESLEKVTVNDYRILVNSFGNLTIVERDDNSSEDILGNKNFSDKKEYFMNTGKVSHKEISDYNFDKLPKLAIKNRGDNLANEVYELFIEALRSGSFKSKKGDDDGEI